MNNIDFEQKLPWYITVMAVLVIIWLLPIILAYLFIVKCIAKPIYSLFGGKK
tara:strand:+ start:197 stop:352 length:156 start_codon:yes stop_codon:yes gene_type:complete